MISCVCLTMSGREHWLDRAIACYESQTWPDKELIIHRGAGTVGQLRNEANAKAHGEVICHWDDDDWSDAGRLRDQHARLTEIGNAVTGYHSMRFTDGDQWWQYSGSAGRALGTSLMYRREWWLWHPFADVQVCEDTAFTHAARCAGELVTADAGDLMVASIHKGNTSRRELTGKQWIRLPNP